MREVRLRKSQWFTGPGTLVSVSTGDHPGHHGTSLSQGKEEIQFWLQNFVNFIRSRNLENSLYILQRVRQRARSMQLTPRSMEL